MCQTGTIEFLPSQEVMRSRRNFRTSCIADRYLSIGKVSICTVFISVTSITFAVYLQYLLITKANVFTMSTAPSLLEFAEVLRIR